MKGPDEVRRDIDRRLARTWAATLTGRDTTAWPKAFPLGHLSSADLGAGFGAVTALVAAWREFAASHDVELQGRTRLVFGTRQNIPTHVVVSDIWNAAAMVADGQWPTLLVRARGRANVLADRYPHLEAPDRVLREVAYFTDLDFDLLCRAADWFTTHDATGLTPRQVPIEGLHAKWLNTRRHLVAQLAGVGDLGLSGRHPSRIHFTYLDPSYRAAGGRLHDSATVGDRLQLPYQPRVVLISENKDTAVGFPEVRGGISIEGQGTGGGTVAAFDWVTGAEHVFYWGDMDADGLEILNGFRDAGVPAVSILMTPAAYQDWCRFGTDIDARGKPLAARDPKPVLHLNADEAALYEQLISPDFTGLRRVEQERIPVTVALAQVRQRIAGSALSDADLVGLM